MVVLRLCAVCLRWLIPRDPKAASKICRRGGFFCSSSIGEGERAVDGGVERLVGARGVGGNAVEEGVENLVGARGVGGSGVVGLDDGEGEGCVDFSVAAEVDVEVVVVDVVVVGCEDKGKDVLFPHIAADLVEHLGLGAIELGGPASHLSAGVFPCGAVIPVFVEVVFDTLGIPKGGEVDGAAKSVLAEVGGLSAIGADTTAVVSAVVHHFGDAACSEVFAELGHGEGEFAAHEHGACGVVAGDPSDAVEGGFEGEGVDHVAGQAGIFDGVFFGIVSDGELESELGDLLVASGCGACTRDANHCLRGSVVVSAF